MREVLDHKWLFNPRIENHESHAAKVQFPGGLKTLEGPPLAAPAVPAERCWHSRHGPCSPTGIVNSANTGPQNGLTPATGYVTIQAGIDRAAAGDMILVENERLQRIRDCRRCRPDHRGRARARPRYWAAHLGNTSGPRASQLPRRRTSAGLTTQLFEGPSAVVVKSGASLTLFSHTIRDNSANTDGGGVDDQGGDVKITGGTVTGNYAGMSGGGAFPTSGGQMEIVGATSRTTRRGIRAAACVSVAAA